MNLISHFRRSVKLVALTALVGLYSTATPEPNTVQVCNITTHGLQLRLVAKSDHGTTRIFLSAATGPMAPALYVGSAPVTPALAPVTLFVMAQVAKINDPGRGRNAQ